MFVAQLHNKLTRSEEDMEDLLTSNVFGIWSYLPIEVAEIGLLELLGTAQRLDGRRFAGPDKLEAIDLKFWPWLQEGDAKGAEPDVLIELTSSDLRKWLLIIESKYLSPKSSFPDKNDPRPNDQLAREMHNLRRMALKRGFDEYALIYVTAHTLVPRDDITEAIHELALKTSDSASDKFYWTTWRRLPSILNTVISSCEEPFCTLLSDLQTIVLRLGLTFFEGMIVKGWSLGDHSWVFRQSEKPAFFRWVPFRVAEYHFTGTPLEFSWVSQRPFNNLTWRWKS